MAIDFPTATTVGQTYTDPTSGNTYVVAVVGPPAQWVGSGSSTNLDSTYLRKDASNDPVTGTLTVTPATNVEGLVVTQPSGNSAAALRITNEGTGNSLLVEDAASTDSTPFVIQNDGTTLIGATAAVGTSKLQVTGGIQTTALNDGPLAGTRNRIINGDMRIDQRNAGATGTIAVGTSTQYMLDRWQAQNTGGTTTFSVGQSSVAPAGFSNSVLITTVTSGASTASDSKIIQQYIEGFNTSDLAFGSASASPITLSFWVRSSLTGSFSGGFGNSDATRTYAFTYTINAANTWEYKTVSIGGDTAGTWATGNTTGLRVTFNIGSGSSFLQSPGSWTGTGTGRGATGTTSLLATASATLYITGVQIEKGSVATEFERRNYGQELALCQRYYEYGGTQLIATGQAGAAFSTTSAFKVTKRAVPTMSFFNTALNNASGIASNTSSIHYANIYTIGSATNTVTLTTDYAASVEL